MFQGVEVPQEIIAASDAKKKKKDKTLAQLPVFRAAANLLYVVTEAVKGGPNSLRKFYDIMLADTAEVMKAIGMADAARNPEDRAWYIDSALVLVNVVKFYLTILRKLGLLEKDVDNKMKRLVRSIIAQLVGWRDYTRSEGAK
ncbi:MAG: hypothetical protein IJ222_03340 [Bacteroidales bacterium]|nr:hypothetical protein [Bacteroidales bacterium]